MRHYFKTTAIAVILLSSAVGTTFAATKAGEHASHNRIPSAAQTQGNYDGDGIDTGDTGSITPMPAPVQVNVNVIKPRLSRIIGELQADTARMNTDRARGLLTNAEFRSLTSEEGRIRGEAVRVARQHDGRIPTVTYTALQAQVRYLGSEISRMS